MKKKKAVAVITARGGSKRIPRKNIKEFCGKPIILYSIEAALKSGVFDEVMVSTDDKEIADIARCAGASVPFLRSAENAGDMAATHQVVLEVLKQYEALGVQFDVVCCIYPTAPFLTAEKLQKSMEKLEESNADGVVPIVAYSFPPQRCFIVEDGAVRYRWEENRLKRSQDLETLYHDCGQFYLLRVDAFRQEQSMVLRHTVPVIMDEMEVQDIDNQEDWELAEAKFLMKHAAKRGQPEEKDLMLRVVQMEDCRFLYELRNEEEVRGNSFHTEWISYEQHEQWFLKKLKQENTQIHILMKGAHAIGQVRTESVDGKAEISYALIKEERGQGYGGWMLARLEKFAKENGLKELVADVKQQNTASRHIFQGLGYEERQTEYGYEYKKLLK